MSRSRIRSRSQISDAPWSWPEDESQGCLCSHFCLNNPWQPTRLVEKLRITYTVQAGPHNKSLQCLSSSVTARQMRRSPFRGFFMSQILMDAVYQELGLSKLGITAQLWATQLHHNIMSADLARHGDNFPRHPFKSCGPPVGTDCALQGKQD